MRPRLFLQCLVAGTALTLVATSCSSSPAPKPLAVKSTTNTGLCKLVAPSVVATALEVSMKYPTTLVYDSDTQCEYAATGRPGTAVIIHFDTHSSASAYDKTKEQFERRGLELGPITGLGNQAYYFSSEAGKSTLATVVVQQGSLLLLTTGTATLDQIGSIARFTLSQYETMHSSAPTSG